jgi:hypothetical protein
MAPPTRAEADALLRSLPSADLVQWSRLSWLYDGDDALQAATALLTASPAPPDATLYGALDVYAHRDPSVAPLVPLLEHAVGVIRATAAGALLARGDARGFPPLVAEVQPQGAWRTAAQQLARWTADGTLGPPLDADAAQLTAAAARLGDWWTANAKTLRFDGSRWRTA